MISTLRLSRTDHRAAAPGRPGGVSVAADPLDDVVSRAAYRLIEAIDRVVRGMGRKIRAGRVRRATIRELSALDDGTLADIGLHRSQIRSVAHALAAETATADRSQHAAANDNAARGPRAASETALAPPRQRAG